MLERAAKRADGGRRRLALHATRRPDETGQARTPCAKSLFKIPKPTYEASFLRKQEALYNRRMSGHSMPFRSGDVKSLDSCFRRNDERGRVRGYQSDMAILNWL